MTPEQDVSAAAARSAHELLQCCSNTVNMECMAETNGELKIADSSLNICREFDPFVVHAGPKTSISTLAARFLCAT